MARYAALLDVFRQVANVLRPENGGTGTQYGEARTVVRGLNSTGASIALYAVVEPTFATNAPKIQKAAATGSADVLGVLVGYYGGSGELVEAACPDGYEAAVQIAGITPVLIESTVTRGEYARVAATDGKISSSSSPVAAGAFARVLESADTSAGATTARIALGVPGGGATGTGGATFGTPSLTLSTSNAAGSSSDAIRTDATVATFDSTAPTTSAVGDSAATGSAGKAARRDHTHGREAFVTPSIAHGTSANAGTATTLIRSDATLATFDSTAPVTQAIGDTAATGSADRAARRDHKHGMPSFGSTSGTVSEGNHTHGAAGGGVWDTVVVKSADEDVSNSTTLQNDDELLVASLTNGGYYEFEAIIFMASPVGGSAPDLKFSFGEDNTFRGYLFRVAGNAGTGTAEIVAGSVQQNQPLSAQTGSTPFGVYVYGSWVSGGGTFRLQWAQNTTNANATRVYAGSTLKLKRLA